MKKSIATIVSFIFMIGLYSQAQTADNTPKRMVFVPQGSFETKITTDSKSEIINTSVDAFWMSNEITNAEYREFVDWAKNNPDKKLYQTKYSAEVFNDPKKGSMKDTLIVKQIPIDVSSFISDMIDPESLEKVNKDYKGYFTDSKYNDYPVVGVSFRMAEYFCLWKTMLENEQMKNKGLPAIQPYRIPYEAEWEYVARQPVVLLDDNKSGQILRKVNVGSANALGLSHLSDNVSEWVKPKRGKTPSVMGGSWKSKEGSPKGAVINPDLKEPYIGFRIVRSYLTQKR